MSIFCLVAVFRSPDYKLDLKNTCFLNQALQSYNQIWENHGRSL